MEILKPYTEMQYLRNILADTFCTGLFLGGILYNVDWAKVLAAIGVIAAIANHAHQIYYRRKNKGKN